MRVDTRARRSQEGFFLIEAMVAILIFAIGILGLVAMGGTAVSSQSDAQYRTEASSLADAIASQISLGVDRTTDATMLTSLQAFEHQPSGAAVDCAFSGTATLLPSVTDITNRAANLVSGEPGLPGATGAQQQIKIDPAAFNRVEITLCWQTANDARPRRHTLVTYINRSSRL